jgi:leucyl-tRNA synthetase
MEEFGPNFEKMPSPEEIKALSETMDGTSLNDNVNETKSKKSKVAAKTVPLKYQAQIMMSIGIPREEVHKFADAAYWLKYFPPVCQDDCSNFGLAIDWRRSFITTDANPFYDSFVRWQMNRLHEMGKIKFGERYTIYSVKDGQPCMDHDRQSGEGLGPQEYTAIKLEVIELAEAAKTKAEVVKHTLEGKKVYFVAATLRPETMYGQTSCFVGPKIEYGMFVDQDEVYICTPRAAKNMAYFTIYGLSDIRYQTFHERGEIREIASFVGKDFIGSRVKAPLSQYPEVRILPMETVLASKGTGVVTSVPSDSPDDFATVTDLAKKAAYYGIEASWASLPPIPIISTPTYGDMAAPTIVKQMKIQSPKDTKLLAEAKEAVYRDGFYNGVMLIGKYKGEKVEEAKPKVRDDLLKSGEAFVYNEPEGLVISRSADECIVALCDQWYLDYGEVEWKARTEK